MHRDMCACVQKQQQQRQMITRIKKPQKLHQMTFEFERLPVPYDCGGQSPDNVSKQNDSELLA